MIYVVYLCTKFDDSSFSKFRYIIRGRKIVSASRDPDHSPFMDVLSSVG